MKSFEPRKGWRMVGFFVCLALFFLAYLYVSTDLIVSVLP